LPTTTTAPTTPTTRPTTIAPPTTKAPTTTTPPVTTGPGGRWVPRPGTTWQWQIDHSTINPVLDVQVYDIDYEHPNIASVISQLHAKGIKVICYVPVGDAENYRSDWSQFQGHLGGAIDGWPDERWVNIKDPAVKPILVARFQKCRDAGADAVEPDMIEAYANDSGLSLTYNDQLVFNRWVADQVHSMDMSIMQKGDSEQAKDLEPWFDGMIQEECYQYGFCADTMPYIQAGKAVFIAEYRTPSAAQCADAKAKGFSLIIKKLSLNAWRETC
jgi:hypothetical protein